MYDKALTVSEDLRNLFINQINNAFIVDMTKCRHPASYKIVLLAIIGLGTKAKEESAVKKRSIEVRISDLDVRNFRVSETVNEQTIKAHIYSSKLFQSLLRL